MCLAGTAMHAPSFQGGLLRNRTNQEWGLPSTFCLYGPFSSVGEGEKFVRTRTPLVGVNQANKEGSRVRNDLAHLPAWGGMRGDPMGQKG